jgi:hypothetical protein
MSPIAEIESSQLSRFSRVLAFVVCDTHTVAVVQTQLNVLVYLRYHADDVLYGLLARIVEPRFFLRPFPEARVDC